MTRFIKFEPQEPDATMVIRRRFKQLLEAYEQRDDDLYNHLVYGRPVLADVVHSLDELNAMGKKKP